ncbi:MAG: hypothetical protein Kow00120_11200 [Anaerolineae bacterium]
MNLRKRWSLPDSPVDRNIRLLYFEMFWSAILGGAITFNEAFAIRLGASNALVGLLSSAPPLIVVTLSIPAARLLERQTDRRPYLLWSLLLMRLGYIVVALLPLLAPAYTANWLVAWLVTLNVPATLFNAGWMPLMADILPERRRAFVFSRRNIIYFAVTAGVTFVAGSWLNATAFPSNYQTLYAFGAAAALVGCATLEKLTIPPSTVPPHGKPTRRRRIPIPTVSLRAVRSEVREEIRGHRSFWNLTVSSFAYTFGIWMSSPLFALYWVRELNADDGWIGLNSGVKSLAVVGGFLLGERLIRRYGFKRVLARMGPLSSLYPFLMALVPDLTFILFAGVMIGFINPCLDLSRTNLLLKLAPRERRATYTSFWITIMNAGAVLAPLLSVALADRIGLRWALFVAATVRLSGALLLLALKIEEPPEEPPAAIEQATGPTAPEGEAAPVVKAAR